MICICIVSENRYHRFAKETYEWLEKEKSVLNAESIFSALGTSKDGMNFWQGG